MEGRPLLNFSSNDYLGLANHPALKEAAARAVEKYGCGSGASRLICGSLAPHHELETALADFKNTDAALTFSTGYAAAVGAICALAGKDDVIVIDKLVHACIVDAARLSGAKLRVFAHNDLNELEEILRWADKRESAAMKAHTLIVTESVFSMDGDLAPLRDMVSLKEKYGAWLMVDEAHATGVFGKHHRGLAEELGVPDHIDIHMGTLGKALGSSGGFISGSRALIDYLINRARSFIFSTAPVPAAAAASLAALNLVRGAEGDALCKQLWNSIDETKKRLGEMGWSAGIVRSPIFPLIIGEESRAVAAAAELRSRGILIPAIRYPTVARGKARLRLTLSAAHTSEDFEKLFDAIGSLTAAPKTFYA